MSKKLIITIAALASFMLVVIFAFATVFGTYNQEVDLRTAIEAKQQDNQSEYDNMWKTVKQAAQVTDREAQLIRDVIVGYAGERGGNGNGGLINAVHESVPNVDAKTMSNLQNTVVGLRQNWTMRQKELVDLNREHSSLLRRFPSNVILGMFGCKEIEIHLVTSTRTDNAFESGKDDDTSVF